MASLPHNSCRVLEDIGAFQFPPASLDEAPDGAFERGLRHGLRVLFTSGYTESAIIHQGKLDDAAELIQKPFRKAPLARKIDTILGHPTDDAGAGS